MRLQRWLPAFAAAFALSAKSAGAADAIAQGNGGNVALGKNWGAYETFGGSAFRWVGNDAEIIVHGNGLAHVTIACEGGPSLGLTSFPLRVLDGAGRQVDHVQCSGQHRPVTLLLPVRGEAHYVLHVDGGGRPVANDKRMLNFRVFSIDGGGTAPGSDIVQSQAGVRLGSGWYGSEHFKGQTFRWIDGDDAQIFASADRDRDTRLRILAAIGPSVGSGSIPVTVRDQSGTTILSTTVRGVQALNFPVHLRRGENLFVVHLGQSKNLRVPGDQRRLNLRVFSVAALR